MIASATFHLLPLNLLLLPLSLRLHVCKDVLNVVELFKALNHLFDGFTLSGCYVLVVVGAVCHLAADFP